MTKKSLATLVMAATALIALSAPGHSAQTSWEYATFGMQSTSWYDQPLTLNKFDSSLGTLTGVEFSLEGRILGDIRFESLDAKPATVTSTLQATLTLKSPSSSTLLTLTPSVSVTDNVTAWDGENNFGGGSGRSHLGMSQSAGPITGNDNANLAFYNGPGTFAVTLSAVGESNATGAGNLLTYFSTQASGTVGVRYTYDAATTPVPEPASLALLGVGGLFGLAYRRRRHGLAAGK